MKKILIMVLSLTMIFSLVSCTTFDNFKSAFLSDESEKSSTPIVFGVYEPLTGEYKAQGKLEAMGIELAHELYPTVLGKEIKLVYADNRSNLYDAKSALENLMAQNPLVVLGSYGEALTLAAGDYLTMYNTTGITISAKSAILTENNEYLFTATYTDDTQAAYLAKFLLEEQKVYNIATVSIADDDTTKSIIQRFNDEVSPVVKKRSGKYTEFEIGITDTNYEETIKALQNARTKAVYLALPLVRAQEFMRQCQNLGYTDIIFVGTRAWATDQMKQFASENTDLKIAYCNDEIEASSGATSGAFLKAYKAKYGNDATPDAKTALAFDSYLLAIEAIENAAEVVSNMSAETYADKGETDAEVRALYEMMIASKASGIPSGRMIRDALLEIEDFEGASSMISYAGEQTASKSVAIIYENNPNLTKQPVYGYTNDGKRYNLFQLYSEEGKQLTAQDIYDHYGNAVVPEKACLKTGEILTLYPETVVFSDEGKKYVLERLYNSKGELLARKNRTLEDGTIEIPESAFDEYNKQVAIYQGTLVKNGAGQKFYIEDYYDQYGEKILPQSLFDEEGIKHIPSVVYDEAGTLITVFTIR